MIASRLPAASILALVVAVTASTGDAHAQSCGMGEVDWYATERANVARAEELLRHGEPEQAAWLLQRTWPRLREAVPVASSLPVIADGVRVMALAAVRANGRVRSELGWSSWTPGERAQNVAWGVRRLRMLAAAEPYSTEVKAGLGEALSRSPATREEARALLESLDASHGISSPEAYAALSSLRREAGDGAGADLAIAECQHQAIDVDVQCAAAGEGEPRELTAAR